MFKEIQKQIDETNAFAERLKALNARIEILLENERQNQIKKAAEMTKLEREINDIIFDQTQKKREPVCVRTSLGVDKVTGLYCPCKSCSPYSLKGNDTVITNSGDLIDHIERLRNLSIVSGASFVVPVLNKRD